MKIITLILSLACNILAVAQKTEAYYDFSWQPTTPENATFYSTIEQTDSGWLKSDYYIRSQKLQMRALYEDKACKIQNGHVYYFHPNGLPSNIGKRVHGRLDGICVSYHINGMMSDSALFRNDAVVDKRYRWHANGYTADSISRINDSTLVQVGWFDDGLLAYAKYEINNKKSGKWRYYHHNGEVSASEVYNNGKMISAEYFDETGKSLIDTSLVNREAMLKGGVEAWRRYLEKSLYWPPGLKFTTSAAVTVGISFTVDENGKVQDVEVYMPFHDEFDRIAVKIIKNSPAWLPAIAHNRKVKAYRRQPVTFVQSE